MSKKSMVKGSKKYGIDEVFTLIGNDYLIGDKVIDKKADVEIDGYLVHRSSLRYKVFYQKGTVCCRCGRKGAYFTLDKETAEYDGNRRHFNLYSEDNVLMTKDHILPRSMGGKDKVSNMQTMCVHCNVKKGHQIEEPDRVLLGMEAQQKAVNAQ